MSKLPVIHSLDQLDKPSQVTKFIIPGVFAIAVLLAPLFRDGAEWTPFLIATVLISVANAPVVFAVGGTKAKVIATAIAAGLQVLVATWSSITQWQDLGAVTYDTWLGVGAAVLSGLGVALIPNAPLAEKVVPVTEGEAAAADPKLQE